MSARMTPDHERKGRVIEIDGKLWFRPPVAYVDDQGRDIVCMFITECVECGRVYDASRRYDAAKWKHVQRHEEDVLRVTGVLTS